MSHKLKSGTIDDREIGKLPVEVTFHRRGTGHHRLHLRMPLGNGIHHRQIGSYLTHPASGHQGKYRSVGKPMSGQKIPS